MTAQLTTIQQKAVSIRDYITSPNIRSQFEAALPSFINPDRFMRTVFTALLRNPDLLDCSKESLLSAMIESAQLGLEPILGKAALIPYGKVVQFQPMYQGLIDLARRSGEIKITAHVVYEKDEFDILYGTDDKIYHKPYLAGDRGSMVGAYTVWTFASGMQTHLFMPESEILDIRNKYSKAYQKEGSPWKKRPGEMYKKTVIKNHAKLQPCSIEVQRAVELDDMAETGKRQNNGSFFGNFEGAIDITEPKDPEPDPADMAEFLQKAKESFHNDFGEGKPELGPVSPIINDFLEKCGGVNDSTPDQVKVEALKDWDNFWPPCREYLKENIPGLGDKKPVPGADKSHNQADFENDLIGEFLNLTNKGLPGYEEKWRDDIGAWPKRVQERFIKKWRDVMKQDYVPGKGPAEDTPAEVAETVDCPEKPGQPTKKNYCDMACTLPKSCVAYLEAWGA